MDHERIILHILSKVLLVKEPAEITQVVGSCASVIDIECPIDRARTTGEILGLLWKLELYSFISSRASKTGSIQIQSDVELVVEEEIKARGTLSVMVCEPAKITKNNECGLYATTGGVMLKNNNAIGEKCIPFLNTQNRVCLTLDKELLLTLEPEVITLEENEDFNEKEKMKAKQRYDQEVTEQKLTHQAWLEHIDIPLWFINQYDDRGRNYDKGYLIKSQGTERKKAAISLNKKVHITLN